MRRQGPFFDSGACAYADTPMHHVSSQRMEHKSQFQDQLEAFTPEREQPYATSKAKGQWRWERDGSKMSNPVASPMFNEGQGVDASRPYFQGQRDQKVGLEKHNNDTRSQPHEENMDVGYEDNRLSQTFEGLERKFLDDIMKLAKEQNNAEDAENARHREKINAINAQHQEQLAALRARHTSRRDEYLQKESHARQQQYQQVIMDHCPSNGMGTADAMRPANPHGYSGATASAAVGDAPRSYNSDQFETYRERARFLGGTRDHGFESRGPYPGGRVYDTGSRYY